MEEYARRGLTRSSLIPPQAPTKALVTIKMIITGEFLVNVIRDRGAIFCQESRVAAFIHEIPFIAWGSQK